MERAELGRTLVIIGLSIAIAGALLWSGVGNWIGKLPGDLSIRRENWSVHFPLATSIVLSVVLSFLVWLFRR